MNMRRDLLLYPCALAICVLSLCTARPVRAENLLEVYAQARAADPLLALADAQRGVQQEVAAQIRAGLLPQWSVNATESSASATGLRSNQVVSNVSQALVDLSLFQRVRAAHTLTSAQEAKLRAAEQDLCARVASAYFGVLSAQAALTTAQANEDAFAQQVDQAEKRFASGLSAMIDVEQARTYHALSRGTTVQAQAALRDAREALTQITGRTAGNLQTLSLQLQPTPPAPQDAAAWVAQALQNNPALKAQQLQVEASEQAIGAARSGHLPTVGLALDSQRLGGEGYAIAETGRFNNTLAVRITVPLFAGGATRAQTRQAVFQRDAAQQSLELAKRALVRETQAQYQAVLSGMALIESTGAAVAASDRALAATRAGQALGTRGMTDLLLAIQSQASAQSALAQARHRYVLATLLLQQASGTLNESALANVNQLLQGNS
ncbi:MAG: TolC family outer membrane protein [Rhodoferax sp.]|nr:TolC family outer membrane protein [Rhodoferax sp.]